MAAIISAASAKPVLTRAAAPRAQPKAAKMAPAPKAAASLKASALTGLKASRKVMTCSARQTVTVQAAEDWASVAAGQENCSPLEVMDHVRARRPTGTPHLHGRNSSPVAGLVRHRHGRRTFKSVPGMGWRPARYRERLRRRPQKVGSESIHPPPTAGDEPRRDARI